MKACLIVIDYQNDFVTGSLGFRGAEELEEKIADKIEQYRKSGAEIIFTLDTHDKDYLSTREGRLLPVEHCIYGTAGHGLYGRVAAAKKNDDKCFLKPCFGSGELFDYLRGGGYDSIELCGVVTNICVISNAVLAQTACPEAEITVDSSCVASNDDKLNQKALDIMQSLQIRIK